MNENPARLDDLALFLIVAETGSLTSAAERSQTPLPTLSRRMTALERVTGRALFLRGKAGYALSQDGQALAQEISGLREIKTRFAQWQNHSQGPQPVRITAGFWTSHALASALAPDPDLVWLPSFVPSYAKFDLARREADIGLRNRPPDQPWLARQRLRLVNYCIYASHSQVTGFITLPDTGPLPASQRWLRDTYPDQISSTASDTRLCLDLALSGFGQILLPCFIGDPHPDLIRRSDPIAELTHDEWLVSHHEARHDPPIRAALFAIQTALTRL